MKNRRLVIGAFLMVAVLSLGVGFAALSDTLSVGGTASYSPEAAADEFNADVYFVSPAVDTGASTCEKTDSIQVTVGDDDTDVNDKLTITVGEDAFTSAGQVAVINVKVQNDSTDAVSVSLDTAAANTMDIDQGVFTIAVTGVDAIAAGDEGVVTITITLNKTVQVEDASISLTLKAESAN